MKKELTKISEETLVKNPSLRQTFDCVGGELCMARDYVLTGLLRYDGKIGEYNNEVYDDIGVRAALYLKYFIAGSYHIERQNILTDLLRNCGEVQRIADIGYGAPGLYVGEYVLAKNETTLFLLDKFDSAERFSRALISCAYPNTNWEKQVSFQKFDFDDEVSPGKFDVYIMFDSIEHAKNPNKSIEVIIGDSPEYAQFLLSLPICPKGGNGHTHFIEWLTENDATNWLKGRGLTIVEEKKVAPTPVDVWAEGFKFYNLIAKCTKA